MIARLKKKSQLADFGYTQIPADEKGGKVRALFDQVAGNYDLMNDLMSLGVHRLWKDEFVKRLAPYDGKELLDVAGGTGDIAARFLTSGGARATIIDPTFGMMREGRDKQRGKKIRWIGGMAEHLPLPDDAFDLYTISFGLRNVTDINAALSEAYRVLRVGGQFLCLEFSAPVWPGLKQVYDAYSAHVLPFLGEKVARDRAAYQYLHESIRRFPAQEKLLEKMRKAGFECARYHNLSGGICAIHQGFKV